MSQITDVAEQNRGHLYNKTAFQTGNLVFRIGAEFVLREETKLMEYKAGGMKIVYLDFLHHGAGGISQNADHTKFCSAWRTDSISIGAHCNFTARLHLPVLLFPPGTRRRQQEQAGIRFLTGDNYQKQTTVTTSELCSRYSARSRGLRLDGTFQKLSVKPSQYRIDPSFSMRGSLSF